MTPQGHDGCHPEGSTWGSASDREAITTPTGTCMRASERTGRGLLCLADGSVYSGQFLDSHYHGQGKLVCKAGSVFEDFDVFDVDEL